MSRLPLTRFVFLWFWQMMKMGKNWDHASLMFFLQELDKDGDGEIEKEEFIAYIQSIEAEVQD